MNAWLIVTVVYLLVAAPAAFVWARDRGESYLSTFLSFAVFAALGLSQAL